MKILNKVVIFASSILAVLTVFISLTYFPGVAFAETPLLEYRLKANSGGTPFQWNDGKTEHLEANSFLSRNDILGVRAHEITDPALAGKYDIEVTHTVSGQEKFRNLGLNGPNPEFCVLVRSHMLQCSTFPNANRGLGDVGIFINGPFSRAEAEKLAADINSSLK